MAKRKTKTRRRSTAVNLLSGLEAFMQTEILLRGTTGTGLKGFITGAADLERRNVLVGVQNSQFQYEMRTFGGDQISLSDFLSNPSLSANIMATNAAQNFVPMAIASISTRVGFKLFKKLFAQPRREANKLIRMSVGKGVATV